VQSPRPEEPGEKYALIIGIKGYPDFPEDERLNFSKVSDEIQHREPLIKASAFPHKVLPAFSSTNSPEPGVTLISECIHWQTSRYASSYDLDISLKYLHS
jgi:hypothetical protein